MFIETTNGVFLVGREWKIYPVNSTIHLSWTLWLKLASRFHDTTLRLTFIINVESHKHQQTYKPREYVSTFVKKIVNYKIIFLYCCRQFRLTNGSAITGTFQATDTLETVCAYINENRTDGSTPFKLMTTFPRKTYTDGDLGMSLQDAGLVPSAVLILTKIWIILLNTILACFRLDYTSVHIKWGSW